MGELLVDSFETLARAKHHIEDFKARVETFALSEPYAFVREVEQEGEGERYKIRLVHAMPSELPAVFADAVHNLRACLDQAAYRASGGQWFSDFPFGKNRADMEDRAKRKSKDIPPKVLQVMFALQPYEGGNHSLWAVHVFDNVGKHRRVIRVRPIFDPKRLGTIGKTALLIVPAWDDVKGEVTVTQVLPGTQQYYDFEVAPLVITEEVEGIKSEAATIQLDRMARQVESALVAIGIACA